MTNVAATEEQRAAASRKAKRLKKLNKAGEREAYCTVFRDASTGFEFVVGGPTKKACAVAFKRLWRTDGTHSRPENPVARLIYKTAFRKLSP